MIKKFMEGYGKGYKPQTFDEAKGDFQLTSLKYALKNEIISKKTSKIIDIGCGNGVLIKILNDSGVFDENPGLKYIGYDSMDSIKEAFAETVEHGLQDKAIFKTISHQWHEELSDNSIVVIRNVFHELDIDEIAEYLFEFCKYTNTTNTLFIQDMTTLPEAEAGNAGWDYRHITNIFENLLDFQVCTVPDQSKGGVELYLLKAVKKNNSCSCVEKKQIIECLINFRHEQLNSLRELINDSVKIDTVRYAHNFLQIYSQLTKLGESISIDCSKALKLLLTETVRLSLKELDIDMLKSNYINKRVEAFQDRGAPLQKLDEFFISDKKFLQINGGKKIGKKSLIYEALLKFKHNRLPIEIDVTYGMDFAMIMEKIFEQLGCGRFFQIELISQFGTLDINLLKEEQYQDFFDLLLKNIILIFYDSENMLDLQGDIKSNEICQFFDYINAYENAKVICDSEREIIFGNSIVESVPIKLTTFPKGQEGNYYQYILHYLQETVSGEYRISENGIGGFPEEILNMAEFHPYFVKVISEIINKQEDCLCLAQPKFLRNIRMELKGHLSDAFQIKGTENEVLFVLSLVSASVIDEEIITHMRKKYNSEIESLVYKGVLYKVNSRSYKRLYAFVTSMDNQKEKNLYKYAYEMFQKLYSDTMKPSYYRAKEYCRIFIEEKQLSPYFKNEITASIDLLFKKKNYLLVINLCEAILQIRHLDNREMLRYAASKVRSKEYIEEGCEDYTALISSNPQWIHAKYSFVDSLMYVGHNTELIADILESVDVEDRNYYWYLKHFELLRMKKQSNLALEALDTALAKCYKYDEIFKVIHTALTYIRTLGIDELYTDWFEYYKKLGEKNSEIEIEYACYLERMGEKEKSAEILLDLYDIKKNNPYYIFSTVNTLCAIGRQKDALYCLNNSMDDIKNNYSGEIMINSAEAAYYASIEEYDKAISILGELLIRDKTNIHLIGQWMDVHYKKASVQKNDNSGIATNGLKFSEVVRKSDNVPALFIMKKLYSLLNDEINIDILQKRIEEIQSQVSA